MTSTAVRFEDVLRLSIYSHTVEAIGESEG